MSIATRVLDLLTGDEPNQPRLTWYGPNDERVELSGRVLANWVTKATNLLVEEGDVEPGSQVLLDIPVHWRALVWALATWCAGGELVLPAEDELDLFADDDDGYEPEDAYEPEDEFELEDEERDEEDEDEAFVPDIEADVPDVAVTARPEAAPDAELVLVVALPALAMRVDEAIPAGALDAAAALMSYGDDLGFVQEPEPADRALSGPDIDGSDAGAVPYTELAEWALHQTPASHRGETRPRVLCIARNHAEMLGHALAAWHAGGSLVLLGEDIAASRFDEIAASEHATVRC